MYSKEDYEKIEERFIICNNTIKHVEPFLEADITDLAFPHTGKALYKAATKIDLQLQVLFTHSRIEDFYVTQILMRTLTEHFLVAYYISIKQQVDKNDRTAQAYYETYSASEVIKRSAYALRVSGIVNKITSNDSLENIISHNPSLEGLTQQMREKLHKESNQFEIKSILNYLLHNSQIEPELSQVNSTMSVLLELYNETSSYIHGGALAEQEAFEFFDERLINTKQVHYYAFGMLMSFLIKEAFFFLLFQFQPEKYFPLLKTWFEYLEKVRSIRVSDEGIWKAWQKMQRE